MKIEAFTPKGKVILDLTVAKDIATFGGQDAADEYIRNAKIQAEKVRLSGDAAEQSLIGKGEIEAK